ncbi:major facilitator superfamily transporter [Fusarium albosuccineum]|uniref:Major facilitator superfamily transporter n=1 Tax=Fusarium albosuccineum TaxID=1237068 RepID=A0A8H4LNX3_9HYPO|nr:major facilitator superfamily transporter [Fusarium albosuccineum]
MADIKDKHDLELQNPSISEGEATSNIERERAELLSRLPDPDAGKSDEERAAIDRNLVRRIDKWLIPWLSLLYLLSFLDRTNIGNARLAGMEPDLNMSGADYNSALSIFFVSYAIFEPVTNALLKKFKPRLFFASIIVIWGTIVTLMGLITNHSGLLAARWFLGMAEAGLLPGVSYYLSCWYKSSEIGVRIAVFFSAAALAGSFGGLLAAAIAQMDGIGNKPGWAWIFIIEGLATVAVGVACWWMVFDWPDTARFLSPDDRTYGYMAINAGALVPIYAFSLFLPTILRGMGHHGTRAQLLSVPPYAVAAVCTVAVGFIADGTRQRGLLSMGTVLIGMAGFSMLIASQNPKVQYAGTFLGATGIYPILPNTMSWAVNNTEGSLKRAIVVGMLAGFGNLNGVVSCNIYLVSESPRFWTGHGVVLGYQVILLFGVSTLMHFGLKAQNVYRRAGKMDAKWDSLTQEEKWFAGDKRPDFAYTV